MNLHLREMFVSDFLAIIKHSCKRFVLYILVSKGYFYFSITSMLQLNLLLFFYERIKCTKCRCFIFCFYISNTNSDKIIWGIYLCMCLFITFLAITLINRHRRSLAIVKHSENWIIYISNPNNLLFIFPFMLLQRSFKILKKC